MAWIQRIPPAISALAFGYGVGMATPEATLDSMRTAVDEARAARPPISVAAGPGVGYGVPPQAYGVVGAPGAHSYAGYGPTAHARAYSHHPTAPGHAPQAPLALRKESMQLSQLRHDAGHSCKLHPTQSVAPAYVSDSPRGWGDVDDLDDAGKDALSRLQLPDFNVAITRRSLNYVRFLTRSSRGRDLFESWLKRSGRYQEMVQQVLREWNLPEDLIWLAMIESGFDPRAKSPAGAMGMWQFMQSTGKVYGLEVNRFIDLRKEPRTATRAAVHHLRDLYQRFGSWDLAMASYNMGYQQLLSAIDRYGTTDFNELARQRAIPSETSNYVPKIIAAALVANNLERYGFGDVKLYRPVSVAELSVPSGTSLKTIAKAAGISRRDLRKHNPHFKMDYTPPGYGDVIVYLPSDTLSRARAALPTMLDDERIVVNDADILDPADLSGFARKRSKRLRHHLWNEDENRLGLLPKPKRRSMRNLLSDRRTPERRERHRDTNLDAVAQEFAPRRGDRDTVMYRVTKGETMIGIARQFAIDIEDLAKDNSLSEDAKLREGALLKLMVRRDVLKNWSKRLGKKDRAAKKRKADEDRPAKSDDGKNKSAKEG